MIQDGLKNKDKDIRGVQKQASELLSCAWQKGYIAGFNDGYATRRNADEYQYNMGYQDGLEDGLNDIRPQGEWIDRMADEGYVECPFCHKQITGGDLNFCVKCGADMREANNETRK